MGFEKIPRPGHNFSVFEGVGSSLAEKHEFTQPIVETCHPGDSFGELVSERPARFVGELHRKAHSGHLHEHTTRCPGSCRDPGSI